MFIPQSCLTLTLLGALVATHPRIYISNITEAQEQALDQACVALQDPTSPADVAVLVGMDQAAVEALCCEQRPELAPVFEALSAIFNAA